MKHVHQMKVVFLHPGQKLLVIALNRHPRKHHRKHHHCGCK